MNTTHRGVVVKQILPLNHLQKNMAKAMKTSLDTLALCQVCRELDLSALQPFETYGLNTFLMASVAQTLTTHPLLNAELTTEGVVQFEFDQPGDGHRPAAGTGCGCFAWGRSDEYQTNGYCLPRPGRSCPQQPLNPGRY